MSFLLILSNFRPLLLIIFTIFLGNQNPGPANHNNTLPSESSIPILCYAQTAVMILISNKSSFPSSSKSLLTKFKLSHPLQSHVHYFSFSINRKRKGKLAKKIKRSPDESTQEHKHMETWYISAITDAFLDQKKVNVFEHAVKLASCECFCKVSPGGCKIGSGEA